MAACPPGMNAGAIIGGRKAREQAFEYAAQQARNGCAALVREPGEPGVEVLMRGGGEGTLPWPLPKREGSFRSSGRRGVLGRSGFLRIQLPLTWRGR